MHQYNHLSHSRFLLTTSLITVNNLCYLCVRITTCIIFVSISLHILSLYTYHKSPYPRTSITTIYRYINIVTVCRTYTNCAADAALIDFIQIGNKTRQLLSDVSIQVLHFANSISPLAKCSSLASGYT